MVNKNNILSKFVPKNVYSVVYPLMIFSRHIGFWTILDSGSLKYFWAITSFISSIAFFALYTYGFIQSASKMPYNELFEPSSLEVLGTLIILYPLLLCTFSTFISTFIYRKDLHLWFLRFSQIDIKLMKIETYVSHFKIFLYTCGMTILVIACILVRLFLHKGQKSWKDMLNDVPYFLPYFNINISATLFMCGLYVVREYHKRVNMKLFYQRQSLFKQEKQSLNLLQESNIKMIELMLEIHSELRDLYYQLNRYFKVSNLLIIFSMTSITVVEIYFLVWSYKLQSVIDMYFVQTLFGFFYNETLFLYILHLAKCCLLQVSKKITN